MGCGASTEAPTNGTRLEFIVESASGLPNVEAIGMIDPYCTVMFQPKVLNWKTEEKENTQTPSWHAFFHCNVTPEQEEKGDLHIVVWNKNTSSDDYLGDVWTTCKGMTHNVAVSRELPLNNSPKGAQDAKVTVTLKLVDFGEGSTKQDTPSSNYQFRPAQEGYQPPASFNAMYANTNFGQAQQQQFQQQPPPQQQQFQQQPPPQQQHHQQQPPPQQQQFQQQPPPQQQQFQQQPPPQQQHHQHHPTGNVGLRSAHGTHLQGNGGQVCTSPNMGAWETWTIETRGSEVVIRSHDGQYLRGDPQNAVNTSPNAAEWETWTIQPHPSEHGKYAIRSHHNTYLRADAGSNGTDLAGSAGAWEAWELVPIVPSGNVGLRSAHGTHLQGNGGQVCTSPNMAAWETWTIETRGSQVVIRSHDGQYLRGNPQNAVDTSPNAAEWETWTIQPHPSEHGKYAIRSHHNTYLRADAGSNGADLAGSAGAWEAWELVRV